MANEHFECPLRNIAEASVSMKCDGKYASVLLMDRAPKNEPLVGVIF